MDLVTDLIAVLISACATVCLWIYFDATMYGIAKPIRWAIKNAFLPGFGLRLYIAERRKTPAPSLNRKRFSELRGPRLIVVALIALFGIVIIGAQIVQHVRAVLQLFINVLTLGPPGIIVCGAALYLANVASCCAILFIVWGSGAVELEAGWSRKSIAERKRYQAIWKSKEEEP